VVVVVAFGRPRGKVVEEGGGLRVLLVVGNVSPGLGGPEKGGGLRMTADDARRGHHRVAPLVFLLKGVVGRGPLVPQPAGGSLRVEDVHVVLDGDGLAVPEDDVAAQGARVRTHILSELAQPPVDPATPRPSDLPNVRQRIARPALLSPFNVLQYASAISSALPFSGTCIAWQA
jgi:hypothetical protein